MSVFWEKGFESASITELTSAMGINSPSLYAAFESKEALLCEAVERYSQTMGSELWGALECTAAVREAFANYLKASATFLARTDTPRGCFVTLGGYNETQANEVACKVFRQYRAEKIKRLEQRLERALAEGELAPDTDCASMAHYFATVQQGMAIHARDGAKEETLRSIAHCAMAAWDNLVANSKDNHPAGTAATI
ncbi:TetR/AcrR family transcriptional regulator [Marinicauda pacifica]|uniref:TetR/AcrR family transcriptional regulator n=1 Tax=Marinicauda pacifica TaxID=1133559 RepID=UPI0035C7FBED